MSGGSGVIVSPLIDLLIISSSLYHKTRNILIDLLGRQASQKASQTRHRNLDNSIKLASVVVERNGLDGFRDRWVEGSKFRELRLAMAKIDKEKEELERKKKSLRKRGK